MTFKIVLTTGKVENYLENFNREKVMLRYDFQIEAEVDERLSFKEVIDKSDGNYSHLIQIVIG